MWHGVSPSGGTEIDVLLFDLECGAFCIEVKAFPIGFIKYLDLQTLERMDGTLGPSPFAQALNATRALGGVLDRTWDGRPYLVPVAAFPLISRGEWMRTFHDGPVGEAATRCVLKDDLADLSALRARLNEIAANPVGGRSRNPSTRRLDERDTDRLQEVLFGSSNSAQVTAIVPTAGPECSPVAPLIDEIIALLQGPGAAYGSPGLEGLMKWQNALTHESDRVRVSLIGEFKSGKSSLINAILKREACYVDEFEATTVNATYTDGAIEDVEVEFDNHQVERWPLRTFLDRCSARNTRSLARVTVTLRTGLPFDLVDSPGLGTDTEGHAAEAEEEIRQTNLLLWTMDCNKAGSARAGAFIQRAQNVALPIVVLLTKADVLKDGEVETLVAYVSQETGVSRDHIIPISAHAYQADGDPGVDKLLERLLRASNCKSETKRAAKDAKSRDVLDGAQEILRHLLELNAPHARFVAAERTYLENSTLGISQAAKVAWIRVLREECSHIVNSLEVQSAGDESRAAEAVRKALPSAVERATTKFVEGLRRLVRDEWQADLQDRSLEFEQRLKHLLERERNADSDLEFLRSERDSFLRRAEVVGSETDPTSDYTRNWVVGIGAVASVITASLLPLAGAALVAAYFIQRHRTTTAVIERLDPLVAAKFEDALVSSFGPVAENIATMIDRIVAEVAIRSLAKLVNDRGGPDLQTILIIEQKSNDLLDELSAVRDL